MAQGGSVSVENLEEESIRLTGAERRVSKKARRSQRKYLTPSKHKESGNFGNAHNAGEADTLNHDYE